MTSYLAIDIETTGVDPETCQVLEIGAVLNDFSRPLMECDTFEMVINPGHIEGEPRGLSMNQRLLNEIADGNGRRGSDAMRCFSNWLDNRHIPKYHLLGKNVGSFDLQFLKRLRGWPGHHIHYRCLEVGSLFATIEGIESQVVICRDLAKKLKIPGKPHEALYDARVSLALARSAWGYHV
jgi:DNA polymerase III epsilon subunit-like protein